MGSGRISKIQALAEVYDLNHLAKDSDKGRLDRQRLQHIVFLLKYHQIPPFSKYDFDYHIRGPYSTELADDARHIQTEARLSGKPVNIPQIMRQLNISPDIHKKVIELLKLSDEDRHIVVDIINIKRFKIKISKKQIYLTLQLERSFPEQTFNRLYPIALKLMRRLPEPTPHRNRVESWRKR